ncbi:hypothetical protein DL93DRAFT_2161230 [Clavulina sp. PMI_390]|nr:hypothetical protein DL93DRAFT_2161230 [Clavulina sp. PMI_390]
MYQRPKALKKGGSPPGPKSPQSTRPTNEPTPPQHTSTRTTSLPPGAYGIAEDESDNDNNDDMSIEILLETNEDIATPSDLERLIEKTKSTFMNVTKRHPEYKPSKEAQEALANMTSFFESPQNANTPTDTPTTDINSKLDYLMNAIEQLRHNKPTYSDKLKQTPPRLPESQYNQPRPQPPARRFDPKRLLIKFEPRINFTDASPGAIVEQVNKALRAAGAPDSATVIGFGLTAHSRQPELTTGPNCEARDLEQFSNIITSAILGDKDRPQVASATAIRQFHQICIERVPRRDIHGNPISLQHLDTAMCQAIRGTNLTSIPYANEPRPLVTKDKWEQAEHASFLINLTSREVADELLRVQRVYIDGRAHKVRPFSDRRPILYCSVCSSRSHLDGSKQCPGHRCEICSAEDHTSATHPNATAPKCINCAGPHPSRDRACPARRHPRPAAYKTPLPPSQHRAQTPPPEPHTRDPRLRAPTPQTTTTTPSQNWEDARKIPWA